MAIRAVGLYLFTGHPKLGWRYSLTVFEGNKIKPHFLMRLDEQGCHQEYQPSAFYYLHYRLEGRKIWERLGQDAQAAAKALEKKRAELAFVAKDSHL